MSVPAAGEPPSGEQLHPAVDAHAFRRSVGQFATGVTVVTTVAGGLDHAMTASAFSSVSLEPPLVLVCVDKDARFHDAVVENGGWGVSFLTSAQRRTADWFAEKGRPLVGQLDRFPHRRGDLTGAALLEGSLGWMECRTTAIYDGGDHDIVLGEVIGAQVGDRDAVPLLYFRGHYREPS